MEQPPVAGRVTWYDQVPSESRDWSVRLHTKTEGAPERETTVMPGSPAAVTE
jgi:hypothetical protein